MPGHPTVQQNEPPSVLHHPETATQQPGRDHRGQEPSPDPVASRDSLERAQRRIILILTGRRVTSRGTARVGRVGRRDVPVLDLRVEDGREGGHLLADAVGAVPRGAVDPVHAARRAHGALVPVRDGGRAAALLGGAGGRGRHERLDGGLVHDAVVEEVRGRVVEDAAHARLPRRRRVGVIVHDGAAVQPDARVVRPLHLVDARAVGARRVPGAVVDVPRVRDEPHALHPVVDLGRPVRVRLVARVARQPRPDVEEAAVRDGVLVRVAVVEGEDLPPQSAAAILLVPACCVLVEDGLGQGEPLDAVGACVVGVEEVHLGGGHGG
ncbi:hypothetical protein VP1G_11117 [Cytospora mali]|uniref:Uncharacterized protein n=1 Tax=Cytospora mali TaxID=578113 RepID=A0A194V607_CYTMA|nr:hypothetical protein VP1G_11117 [Valsa mali var. pyri (nom. inval.)]